MRTISVRNPNQLQAALDAAQAGDEILVFGGTYGSRSEIRGKTGPITIRAGDAVEISGNTAPKPDDKGDFSFLQIKDCEGILIEGLKVKNFWPIIFDIKRSTFVTIRNCHLVGATKAISAKNGASHLLIEGNNWVQDESPNHDLWHKIDWREAHGDEGAGNTYNYFNGGFLWASGIRGKVIVRRNRIQDAYNGIRLKYKKDDLSIPERARWNSDVYIVENEFLRIRDNPVEPETLAWNWHVRNNSLVDCHSWFSFDDVSGGYFYIYGNDGRFDTRQGRPWEAQHTMGRVLKLSYSRSKWDCLKEMRIVETQWFPVAPWYVFNNSWHLRCPIIGGSSPALPPDDDRSPDTIEGPDYTAKLSFFNNAFTWCDPVATDNWICETIDLVRNFDWRSDASLFFDANVSDRGDYFALMRNVYSSEPNGVLTKSPIFADAIAGNFRPSAKSAVLNAGISPEIELHDKAVAQIQVASAGARPNCGKFQDYGPTEVLALEAQYTALVAAIAGRFSEAGFGFGHTNRIAKA